MPLGKPQAWFPGINRAHPLHNGLIVASCLNEGVGQTVRDYAGLRDATFASGTPQWRGTPDGFGLKFDDTDTTTVDYGFQAADKIIMANDTFSFAMRLRWDTTMGSLDGLFGLRPSVFSIRFETGPNALTLLLNGATSTLSYQPNSHLGETVNLVFTFERPTGLLYIDGTQVGSATRDVTPLSNSDTLYLGTDFNAGTRTPNMTAFTFLGWDRTLSPIDAQTLHADPYGVFRRNRIAVLSAGVSAADTISKIVGPGGLAGGHRLAGDGGGIAA